MKYATRLSTDGLRHLKHSHQLRAMMKRRDRLGLSIQFVAPCSHSSAPCTPSVARAIAERFAQMGEEVAK